MRQLDTLTPAEIKAAIPEVFPESGHAQSYQVVWAVAEKLGSGNQAVPQGYTGNRVQERYTGRVKRALDALAAEGTLVKVPAGDRLPDGRPQSIREVRYYTPAAFEAATAAHAVRQAAGAQEKARWEKVAERLGAVDVALGNGGSLTLDDWENLLEAADL